jgi:hypothetical protein
MVRGTVSLLTAAALAMCALAACEKKKSEVKDELKQGKYVPPVERKLKPLPKFKCEVKGNLVKWRFDPTMSPLPDGKVLVAGGRQRDGGGWLQETELYDPGTGESKPGPKMKMPRAMHSAMVLADGRTLVYSGMVKELELYDPKKNAWVSGGKLKKDILGAAAVQLPDGKVLIGGGDPMGAADFSTTTYLWDPKTRRHKKGPAIKEGRQGDAFLTKDGKVVLLARPYGETRRTLESWDLTTGDLKPFKFEKDDVMWKSLKELGSMRGGEHVKLARGADGKVAMPPTALRGKSVLRFFPSRSAWRTLGKLKYDHKDGAIIALTADKILVVGGRKKEASAVEICTPEEKK